VNCIDPFPLGCSHKKVSDLLFHAGNNPHEARGNTGIDIHHIGPVGKDDVDPTVSLAPQDIQSLDCGPDDLIVAGVMHGSLPAKIVEPALLINPDMLPVHCKEEGGLSRVITAGIPYQTAADKTDAQMFTIDKLLGDLARSRIPG
jgi:hypothetical protein